MISVLISTLYKIHSITTIYHLPYYINYQLHHNIFHKKNLFLTIPPHILSGKTDQNYKPTHKNSKPFRIINTALLHLPCHAQCP